MKKDFRYMKTFEELSSDTYLSAADELSKLAYHDRAEEVGYYGAMQRINELPNKDAILDKIDDVFVNLLLKDKKEYVYLYKRNTMNFIDRYKTRFLTRYTDKPDGEVYMRYNKSNNVLNVDGSKIISLLHELSAEELGYIFLKKVKEIYDLDIKTCIVDNEESKFNKQ